VAKGFQDKRYRQLVDQLVAARKQANLSQERVATLLGTHQQFVSRYETGERRLDAIELVDVARALGLNPVDLIGQF
jgi:transcriptional regulator with XRE-family HTH domain